MMLLAFGKPPNKLFRVYISAIATVSNFKKFFQNPLPYTPYMVYAGKDAAIYVVILLQAKKGFGE
jgi:hypothetical protein